MPREGVKEMLTTESESKHSGPLKMIMTLNLLSSHHVAGAVLSACHASSHVILKTAPKGVIIPILGMRKLWFVARYPDHTHRK